MKIFNLYGITEITIHATFYECQNNVYKNQGILSIGRVFDKEALYIKKTRKEVLDDKLKNGKQGEDTITLKENHTSRNDGELFISGIGLARGYLGRGSVSAERFIPNGLLRRRSDDMAICGLNNVSDYTSVYKTGDLCRYMRMVTWNIWEE